jgi:hypothetical protein
MTVDAVIVRAAAYGFLELFKTFLELSYKVEFGAWLDTLVRFLFRR